MCDISIIGPQIQNVIFFTCFISFNIRAFHYLYGVTDKLNQNDTSGKTYEQEDELCENLGYGKLIKSSIRSCSHGRPAR